MIAVGLMSGTSADGIDAAAVDVAPGPRILAHRHAPFAGELRARVLAAAEGAPLDARSLARLHGEIGDAYAAAAVALLEALPHRPDVIGMHGQTLAHLPGERVTLQAGDAARVAIRAGIPVVADFRSADVAAGGQGAPLVPYADHAFFADGTPRAVLNLGGIANLTLLPSERAEDVRAFDTGPGNMVLDVLAAHAGAAMDAGGTLAARGRASERALARALAHPFFSRRGPRSTGREEFGALFADLLLADVRGEGGSLEDALATAVALTARSVAGALGAATPPGIAWREVLAAGGGVRNGALMAALAAALAPVPIVPADERGVPAQAREAAAFAVLAARRLRGETNTLPACTGASRAVSAGALYLP